MTDIHIYMAGVDPYVLTIDKDSYYLHGGLPPSGQTPPSSQPGETKFTFDPKNIPTPIPVAASNFIAPDLQRNDELVSAVNSLPRSGGQLRLMYEADQTDADSMTINLDGLIKALRDPDTAEVDSVTLYSQRNAEWSDG